ncbi:C1 family peptidase [uncultured Tenacibaculum sp.]|uniref:C1 family peptidase n=1 Tax=uncultured Tenacibaculum sp. TaxID=174713 RepID=UPI00262708AB|nr:C1 family peptidase [uncultured Tenacibaculum sp.]
MKKVLFLIVFLLPIMGIKAQKLNTVSNLLPVVHWKSQSPVKHQGVKYTCTAFAIAATLETFPGVPKDLSEKYLYALQKGYQFAKDAKIKRGHFLMHYPNSLIRDGAIEEKYLPYKLNYDKVRSMNETQFDAYMIESEIGFVTLLTKYKDKAVVFVDEYEYLEGKKAKNVEYLKYLLRSGVKAIPVSYPILYKPAWKSYASRNFQTITPDKGFKVRGPNGNFLKYSAAKGWYPNINQQIVDGTVSMEFSDTGDQYIGHAVTIIGYDNKGFIIKNSYGPQWRVGGYERVSYDFHEIFAIEALIIKKVKVKKRGWF